MNSAIARRSAAVRLLAIVTIEPVSIDASTRSAGIARNASRFGARFTDVAWHDAQFRWYNAAPSGACPRADCGTQTTVSIATAHSDLLIIGLPSDRHRGGR